MSQETVLALLRAFGPLSAQDIANTGMMCHSTAAYALGRLKHYGEVWGMEGRRWEGGRLFLWGAV